jgi:hypothetical protein
MITGHQLRASMELHTIELSLPGLVVQQEFKTFGQLATKSWLKHLWEFCDNIQLIQQLLPQILGKWTSPTPPNWH